MKSANTKSGLNDPRKLAVGDERNTAGGAETIRPFIGPEFRCIKLALVCQSKAAKSHFDCAGRRAKEHPTRRGPRQGAPEQDGCAGSSSEAGSADTYCQCSVSRHIQAGGNSNCILPVRHLDWKRRDGARSTLGATAASGAKVYMAGRAPLGTNSIQNRVVAIQPVASAGGTQPLFVRTGSAISHLGCFA